MIGLPQWLGFCSAAVLLGACASDSRDLATLPSHAALEGQLPPLSVVEANATGLDATFLAIASTRSTFGGLWLDGKNQLVVARTQGGDLEQLHDAVRVGLSRFPAGMANAPVRDTIVSFSFQQLATWREALRAALAGLDPSSLDADEAHNRVTVRLRDISNAGILVARAGQLGIPKDALWITEAPQAELVSNVTDRMRPIPNGIQFQYGDSLGVVWGCSVGADVIYNGQRGFVSAGHCSTFGNGGGGGPSTSPLFQNVWSGNFPYYFVGTVQLNPPMWSGGPCTPGFVCRYSDAEWIPYWQSSQYSGKKIAETTVIGTSGPGSLTIGTQRTALGVASLIVGNTVRHTGRSSGTTQGQITATCSDQFAPGWHENLCQSEVLAYAKEGDSGGPVYFIDNGPGGSGATYHVGILWGSSQSIWYYFSPWSGITNDLGVYY